MNQIKVKAAPGVRVPMEGQARRYITDADPVTITLTAYYRRQMSAGDLLEYIDVPDGQETAKATRATKPAAEEKQEQVTEVASGKSRH